MQTFLPEPNLSLSATCLDYKRLGKQRSEAKQILLTLDGKSNGWKHHPAVKMWENHILALARYGLICCIEWQRRGYNDNLYEFFFHYDQLRYANEIAMPYWFGDMYFHRSHRFNLLRKDFSYYAPLFPIEAAMGEKFCQNQPYVWPSSPNKNLHIN